MGNPAEPNHAPLNEHASLSAVFISFKYSASSLKICLDRPTIYAFRLNVFSAEYASLFLKRRDLNTSLR